MEDEDYELIAENTGIQLQRKKFRRVHGNVLDSDDEEVETEQQPEVTTKTRGERAKGSMGRDDSLDSPQDEDFAHVRS